MPRIVLLAKPGRSAEQKRILASRITDAVADTFEVEPATVTIIFADLHDDQVAEGGVFKSEASDALGK